MKKIFALFLSLAFIFLTACNTKPPVVTESSSSSIKAESTPSVTPPDEETILHTASTASDDGVTLKIVAHGYRSKSSRMDFYAKSNEYFLIDVEVTNGSSEPIYYFLPRYCNEDVLPHNHEIGFDLSCGEYDLHSSSSGFIIAIPHNIEDDYIRTLAPGETHTWQLKLAAGEISADDFDLPADGKAYSSGIKLYGPELYTDGICTFEGTVFFGYSKSEFPMPRSVHDLLLSVPLSVGFVYVSP